MIAARKWPGTLCLLLLLSVSPGWARKKPAPGATPSAEGGLDIQKTFTCMNRCNQSQKQCTNKCNGDRACLETCNQKTQSCREPCLGGGLTGKGKETMTCLVRCGKEQRQCDGKCGDDETCKEQCEEKTGECREPCLKGGVGEKGRATFECVVRCDKQRKLCIKGCQDQPGCAETCGVKNNECRQPCLKNRSE